MTDQPPIRQQQIKEPCEVQAGTCSQDKSSYFQEVFWAHYPYVFNSLRRLGVHPNDIEDLAQEVFVTAYRRVDDFDRARPARPWLFGIAYRVVAQHRRDTRQDRAVSAQDVSEAVDGSEGADDLLDRRDDQRMVLEALGSVELDRRAVLLMHDLDGICMPDIAGTIGIPVNTAYSRLRLAREEFASAVKRVRAKRGER
jgi:RNA polymerase sigma-70 factor, ECF subfamily